MRKLIWSLLLCLAACGPVHPPAPPPDPTPIPDPTPPPPPPPPPPALTYTLVVRVCEVKCPAVVPDGVVTLTLASDIRTAPIDAAGRAVFLSLPAGDWQAGVASRGYVARAVGMPVSASTEVAVALVRVNGANVRGPLYIDPADPRHLRRAQDKSLFRWRGHTSFALVSLVAEGHANLALDQLFALRAQGYTGVRVLTMVDWLNLTPAKGIAALPTLLALALRADLYVDVVGGAGTIPLHVTRAQLTTHLQRLGAACLAAGNCIAEVANEPYHGSQQPWLNDGAALRELRTHLPPQVLTALGAARLDETLPYGIGNLLTVHLDRSRLTWDMVRHIREAEGLSGREHVPVIVNETRGASDTEEGTSRTKNCQMFYALGFLARGLEIGITFHPDAGVQSVWPLPPNQAVCSTAFILGSTFVPDARVMRFENTGWASSPIASADFTKVLRIYSFIGRDESFSAYINPVSADLRVVYKNGWRAGEPYVTRPGFAVLRITK